LIDNQGFSPDAASYEDVVPLHYAAFYGQLEVIKVLIERGANVNYKSIHGWIPLHDAGGEGHLSCAVYLIQKGSDETVKNKYGKTWKELAEDKHGKEFVNRIYKQVELEHYNSIEAIKQRLEAAKLSVISDRVTSYIAINNIQADFNNLLQLRRT